MVLLCFSMNHVGWGSERVLERGSAWAVLGWRGGALHKRISLGWIARRRRLSKHLSAPLSTAASALLRMVISSPTQALVHAYNVPQ